MGAKTDASAATLMPEFLCPLTRELMRDPVFTADGQTYEREAIEAWLRDHDTSPSQRRGSTLIGSWPTWHCAVPSAASARPSRNFERSLFHKHCRLQVSEISCSHVCSRPI